MPVTLPTYAFKLTQIQSVLALSLIDDELELLASRLKKPQETQNPPERSRADQFGPELLWNDGPRRKKIFRPGATSGRMSLHLSIGTPKWRDKFFVRLPSVSFLFLSIGCCTQVSHLNPWQESTKLNRPIFPL
jgi:hypothetical protein